MSIEMTHEGLVDWMLNFSPTGNQISYFEYLGLGSLSGDTWVWNSENVNRLSEHEIAEYYFSLDNT